MLISDINKIKAVLIDDTSFTRMTTCRMMEQIGFQDLIEFEDGAIASQNLPLLTSPAGLIVADYHMPGLDGLELLRAVRSGQIDNIAPDIPFIMVTGEGKL